MDVQPWEQPQPRQQPYPPQAYPPQSYPPQSYPPQPNPAQTWQPAGMRAAQTDRDRTVDVLKAAYAEGRLSAEEYSDRFDHAQQAKTYGQLAQLVADLPAGPMVGQPAGVPQTFLAPAPAPAPRTSPAAVASLVLGLLCVPTLGLLGLPAVVTGHLATRQIRAQGESGEGMALAGLLLGWLSVTGWLALIAIGLMTSG
ncbi:DUF1707 and DUF4190 domain-containing protein [Kitasatospora sp. McL0602]|uniref:DUF1707 and DUF4190 domain-containing protein n=1 Tax=Kitasatospora sp. McL0602 TaxID=3439530 RepID=UPI003F8870F3